jgi:anti-sigma regulatory factor (Ser/Thr protein kinase)
MKGGGELTQVETSRTFLPNSDAPRGARTFVAQILNQAGATERADDVRWVVSELATKAVLDAGTPFTVSVWVDDQEVDIVVSDESPRLPNVDASNEDESRPGLFLVSTLADKWTTEKLPSGERIWVQLQRRET